MKFFRLPCFSVVATLFVIFPTVHGGSAAPDGCTGTVAFAPVARYESGIVLSVEVTGASTLIPRAVATLAVEFKDMTPETLAALPKGLEFSGTVRGVTAYSFKGTRVWSCGQVYEPDNGS